MVRLVSGCILLSLAAVGVLVTVFVPPVPSAMVAREPMALPRMGAVTAVVGDTLFVIGGAREVPPLATVERYNWRQGSWSAGPPLLTARQVAAGTAIDGRVYVAGGKGDTSILASFERLEAVRGAWEALPDMPEARWNHGLVSAAGRIYALGGLGMQGPTARLDCFDPSTRTWTTKAPLPFAKQGAAVAVLGERIYVMGGRIGSGRRGEATRTVEIYDVTQDRWSTGTPMFEARVGAQAAVVGDRIFVVGGAAGGGPRATITVFDSSTQRWSPAQARLRTAKTGHAVAAAEGRIFVVGGATKPELAAIVPEMDELIVDPAVLAAGGHIAAAHRENLTVLAILAGGGGLLFFSGWRHRVRYRRIVKYAQTEHAAGRTPVPAEIARVLSMGEPDVTKLLRRAAARKEIPAMAGVPTAAAPVPIASRPVEPPPLPPQEPPRV